MQMINTDYGIHIPLLISYAFVYFVTFTFVAMEAKHDPSLEDCEDVSRVSGL